ncbi:peptidase M76 family protein [Toxoplasma gondii p89]|uniref:Peptidase M76 family protein n=1 Tax=Toxoplasma gondii p89 TaxID=943119 RepID=A0A086L195_TOXGO|nr:peptidase M76 family protein [Toxoplasma gondii p89]
MPGKLDTQGRLTLAPRRAFLCRNRLQVSCDSIRFSASFRRCSQKLLPPACCAEPPTKLRNSEMTLSDAPTAPVALDTSWHSEWRWLSWLVKSRQTEESSFQQPDQYGNRGSSSRENVCSVPGIAAPPTSSASPSSLSTSTSACTSPASPPSSPDSRSAFLASACAAQAPLSQSSVASMSKPLSAAETQDKRIGVSATQNAAAEASSCAALLPPSLSSCEEDRTPSAGGASPPRKKATPVSHVSPAPRGSEVETVSKSAESEESQRAASPTSPLLQFGDETLSWLQRQQMKLWSFFALRDWRVKTLVHALSAMGAPVDLIVVDCAQTSGRGSAPPPHRGGYSPVYHTVWLCGNCFWSPFELRRVLLHELVHAFDFARAELSPENCRHVACTEIRAYNLSGQCSWWATKRWDEDQFQRIDPAFLRPRNRGLSTQGEKGDASVHAETREERSPHRDAAGSEQTAGERQLPLFGGTVAQVTRDCRTTAGEGDQQMGVSAQSFKHGGDPVFLSGNGAMPWQDTKRNRCLVHNALNSLRDHQQCKAPGIAEIAITDVFQRCLRDTWPFMVPPERDSKWRPSRIWREGSSDFFKK